MITEECRFHSGRPANHNLSMDKSEKKAVFVCCECFERMTTAQPCCQYCGIQVISIDNYAPKYGIKPHKEDCPRREDFDGDALRSVS